MFTAWRWSTCEINKCYFFVYLVCVEYPILYCIMWVYKWHPKVCFLALNIPLTHKTHTNNPMWVVQSSVQTHTHLCGWSIGHYSHNDIHTSMHNTHARMHTNNNTYTYNISKHSRCQRQYSSCISLSTQLLWIPHPAYFIHAHLPGHKYRYNLAPPHTIHTPN